MLLVHFQHFCLPARMFAVQLTNRPDPRDRNQAMVSLQHWAAASLVYRVAGIAQLAETVLHDPAVRDLRRKVVAITDPAVGREAASARVVLKGGETVAAQVLHCRGSVGRPMTDADITDKTRAQLRIVYPDAAVEQILAECWRIEKYPQVDLFSKRLRLSA